MSSHIKWVGSITQKMFCLIVEKTDEKFYQGVRNELNLRIILVPKLQLGDPLRETPVSH